MILHFGFAIVDCASRAVLGPGRLLVLVVLLGACTTHRVTTSDGWPLPPPPREAPSPPASAKADRMVFTVGMRPGDSNNNGFPDTILASVQLFARDHPTALQQEGAFVFTLYPQGKSGGSAREAASGGSVGGEAITSWRIEGESPRRAVASTLAGPCYRFELSLLDLGDDRLPLSAADLVCRFEPRDGSPHVTSDGVRTIQIGRRVAAGP